MKLMAKDFEAMRNVDVQTIDRDELIDITEIHISCELPQEKRILEYIMQTKNPYCYKHGDMVIKESFSNNGNTIDDCMEQYIAALL